MSTTRTIQISALNIAMHQPHSPKQYISLFKDAKKLRELVRLDSLHWAMLGLLYGPKAGAKNAELTGEIYRFVKLDPHEPWFNTETREAATDDEVGGIKIPAHLLPHLQRVEFVFKPDVHELWFISQDRKDRLGPQTAVKFFQRLFESLVQSGKYPPIEVTAIPDRDTLDEMFSLSKLEKIVIELKRPNADDAAGEEAKWLKKLAKQNARKITTELVAVAGESILPDQETRALAAVAARNGNVSVIGRDANGKKVDESTKSRPLMIPQQVDSDIETSMDVLLRAAE